MLKSLKNEYMLWIFIGIIFLARPIGSLSYIFLSGDYDAILELLDTYYFEMLVGVIVLLFPRVYRETFGMYPIHSLLEKSKEPNILIQGAGNTIHVPQNKDSINKTNYGEIKSGIELLTQLVANAEELSKKMYTRSGIFLIFGVLIAFIGIFFFSLKTTTLTPINENVVSALISILPNFGVLFFIEFIAFFFLRQYRSSMNEFRYYDEVKRNRESQLSLYMIALKDFKVKDFNIIADKIEIFGKVGILSKGQTTEYIESSKLNENELKEHIQQILELLKVSQKEPKPN